MEGIIFDIKQFAVHDGPGIRTTVFFKGCPLSCAWCHNPESKEPGITKIERSYKIEDRERIIIEDVGKKISVIDLMDELSKDMHVMEESGGGVTVSGGEPLFQFNFLKELLIKLNEAGIHTCVDTTGYANGNKIIEILPFVDLFLYDLKHYDEKKHIAHTGVSLKPIKDNLILILKNRNKVCLRIPVIPGINDSEEDIFGFPDFIKELPGTPDQIDLLPYHNIAKNKYERLKKFNFFANVPGTDPEKLNSFKDILIKAGFNVKIGA